MTAKFFKPIVYDIAKEPGEIGLSVGYELENWRQPQLVDYLMDWLPEFALTYADYSDGIPAHQLRRFAIKAAANIYKTEKFKKRGEFGELLLHAILREVFQTAPAVSKVYYKSANNDTVKGFDAVHIVAAEDRLELWLGEVKFYKSASNAIADIAEELKQHTRIDYLKNEFALILNKVDDQLPHSDRLNALLDPNTSLDEVFDALCIPALITHDSECVKHHSKHDEVYEAAFSEESAKLYKSFTEKNLPRKVKIHFIHVPLLSKTKLSEELHERLKGWHAL